VAAVAAAGEVTAILGEHTGEGEVPAIPSARTAGEALEKQNVHIVHMMDDCSNVAAAGEVVATQTVRTAAEEALETRHAAGVVLVIRCVHTAEVATGTQGARTAGEMGVLVKAAVASSAEERSAAESAGRPCIAAALAAPCTAAARTPAGAHTEPRSRWVGPDTSVGDRACTPAAAAADAQRARPAQ
jgi:hypothetical protein